MKIVLNEQTTIVEDFQQFLNYLNLQPKTKLKAKSINIQQEKGKAPTQYGNFDW